MNLICFSGCIYFLSIVNHIASYTVYKRPTQFPQSNRDYYVSVDNYCGTTQQNSHKTRMNDNKSQ